jgi:hypothetical protein
MIYNNETEKLKADFDATLQSFPVQEVLDFLKEAKGTKLEKLVGAWVLDEGNKKEIAVNLGIIQEETTSSDQEEEQEGGDDEDAPESPAHSDTEESGEDRTPISENRDNEELESNKLLAAPAVHSSQSIDDLFATYIQNQEKEDQNKENATSGDIIANQFKRLAKFPTVGFKQKLRDTVNNLVAERREYLDFVKEQITILETASERLGSSIEADRKAAAQSTRFPKKQKKKRMKGLVFERPANSILPNPFYLDEADPA